MIGNDIVDLQYAAQHHNWRRAGYLRKVFTAQERVRIENSTTPDRLVWTLWSAKESAYKLSVQQGAARKYAPKQLVTAYLTTQDDGHAIYSVRYQGGSCYVIVEQDSSYIHSVALPHSSIWENVQIGKVELSTDDVAGQRSRLRRALYSNYIKQTRAIATDYRIRKSPAGIPMLFAGEELVGISVSLSHHGHFGAFAYDVVNSSTSHVTQIVAE